MTVKQLIDHLSQYPPNMQVVTSRYSEYFEMTPDEITTTKMFKNGGYISRIYRPQDEPLGEEVLYFEGN